MKIHFSRAFCTRNVDHDLISIPADVAIDTSVMFNSQGEIVSFYLRPSFDASAIVLIDSLASMKISFVLE